MEAARLGLNDFHGTNRLNLGSSRSSALGLDPWLTSGPTTSLLPGFINHPQTGYPSYLTAAAAAAAIAAATTSPVTLTQSVSAASSASPLMLNRSGMGHHLESFDSRSSSIAVLRLKAKEHADSINKSFQQII